MKKEYTRPELSFTSYEADANVMLNTSTATQTTFSNKTNYSTIVW